MKAQMTAVLKRSGNSTCIFVPKVQMDIIGVRLGDVVKVTIEKIDENPTEDQ